MQRYKPLPGARIKDGFSHTLMAGDKRLNIANLGKAQRDDNEGYTVGWNADTLRRTDRGPLPDYRGNEDDYGDKRFGASHPSVWNALVADGSCRAITYDVDLETFRRFGERNDGATFDWDSL